MVRGRGGTRGPAARTLLAISLLAISLAGAAGCDGAIGDPTSRGMPGDGLTSPDAPIVDDDIVADDPLGARACSAPGPGPRILRPLTRDEYRAAVSALLGRAPSIDRLPAENRAAGYVSNAEAQSFTVRHVDEYLAAAEQVTADLPPVTFERYAACDPATAACARQFVESFGKRAFRRPLAEDEVSRYVALFDPGLTGGEADVGRSLAAQAMLASPNFLYRSEVGELADGGVFRLTSYEVATALSFELLGEPPDDALLALADADVLRAPSEIERVAERLSIDARARARVATFASEWLGTHAIRAANKDAAIYPSFTGEVREAMIEEERRFVTHVVFDGSGRFRELFDADYGFVDGNLAAFYGVGGGGSEFERVVFPAEVARGGVLRLGSVLASHAHANESSPIKRGLFVRARLLCQDLPSPPPSADTTPPGLDPTLTTRARFARHTADPTCRGCHQYIDEVGFAFEAYDGVGAHRTEENGMAIDARGTLLGPDELTPDVAVPFLGPDGLGTALAESDRAVACVARQYFRHTRGFVERPADTCAVEELGAQMIASGGDLRALLVAPFLQRSFLERRPPTGDSP